VTAGTVPIDSLRAHPVQRSEVVLMEARQFLEAGDAGPGRARGAGTATPVGKSAVMVAGRSASFFSARFAWTVRLSGWLASLARLASGRQAAP
jgi:hypothetical protein